MANRPTSRKKTYGTAKSGLNIKAVPNVPNYPYGTGTIRNDQPKKTKRGSGGAMRIKMPQGDSILVVTHSHGKQVKFK